MHAVLFVSGGHKQHSNINVKLNCMTLDDMRILVKKIAVGILIFLVPLFIIAAILWLIQNRF